MLLNCYQDVWHQFTPDLSPIPKERADERCPDERFGDWN